MTIDCATWLIAVKDGMPYFPQTLASIAAQTSSKWGVLIWDNGSIDGTQEELKKWIPEHMPGQFFVGDPLRLADSRARLVEACQSEFCALIDADDVNQPDRLEKQFDFLCHHPDVAVLGTQINRLSSDGKNEGSFSSYPLDHDDIVHAMLTGNPIAQPTVLMRRSAILDSGNYVDVGDVNVEDYDLWLRVASRYRLANLPAHLLNYRVHPKSTTQVAMARNNLQEAMQKCLCEHAPNLYGCTKEEVKQMSQRQHPCVIKVLLRIARHLCKNQRGSTLSLFQRMTSASFISAGKTLVSPQDLISRGALILLQVFCSLRKASHRVRAT